NSIPQRIPESIALLKNVRSATWKVLTAEFVVPDTDWFQSTSHELVNLWPRVAEGGFLIIDDSGAWAGAKKAVDEYFEYMGLRPLRHRIDGCGKLVIKNSANQSNSLIGNEGTMELLAAHEYLRERLEPRPRGSGLFMPLGFAYFDQEPSAGTYIARA